LRAFLPKDQRRLYSDLAWTWPIISPPEDYVDEGQQFLKAIREHAQFKAKTLLNLGCGGGHNDYTLKKEFKITGVDVSQAMLKLARGLNPEVRYLPGDMRTLRLDETFDAVLIADSINYMLTEKDLRAAFLTAFAHLKPGGVFCTYVEQTKKNFQQNKTQCSKHTQGDIEITFIENLYDPDPKDTTYETTFVYLIRREGKLEIETDHHLCGIFDLETWLDLLKEVDFQVKQMEFVEVDIPMLVGIKSL
jgi:SAM-dependent methyltransferase